MSRPAILIAMLAATAAIACAPKPSTMNADQSAEEDQCGAARYQSLIGKGRADIPAQPANATWRITCTTCPVTMDYNPARLNIFFDEKTGVIEQVKCG